MKVLVEIEDEHFKRAFVEQHDNMGWLMLNTLVQSVDVIDVVGVEVEAE